MTIRGRATEPGAPAVPGSGRRRKLHSDGWWPVVFVGPLMLGVAVFYHYPIVKNLYLSMTQSGAFGTNVTWVGLQNYVELFERPDFGSAFLNSLTYTLAVLLGIPIAVIISACLALPRLRGAVIYRTLFFLPYIAMPVAVALVWRIIFNGDFGLVNQFLRGLGMESPPFWLATPGYALAVICLFGIWSSIGFNVIILSAGIAGIPAELYEAASLDGASRLRQFWSVTVPLLSPSIFLLAVVQTIAGFQLFDAIYALMGTNNPALPHTRSLVYLFYYEAFTTNNKGNGAAVAVVIMGIIAVITALQFMIRRKWGHQ